MRGHRRLQIFALLLALAALAGCAINPATGKRQLVLISESQEIEMGRENDRQLAEQLGLYDDPELQEYVSGIGAQLAGLSERPHLDWTFRVVDDSVVNAFALPGGYIYITRGILTYFNNEAEMASVIGHEIGHVTARHSVNQMSKAQLMQLGLGASQAIVPERAEQITRLAEMGLGLLMLKYSRDDERQADTLGLRYMTRGGYNPRPMADVFSMLGRVSGGDAGERLPGWMSTHPLPENRHERMNSEIAATGQDFSGRPIHRDEYLRKIDGILFGPDPREGFFRENLFLHPDMKLRLRFPDGWKAQNQKQAVVAVSPEQDAMLVLTHAGESTAAEALRVFLAQEGISSVGSGVGPVNRMTTSSTTFAVAQETEALQGLVAFVEYGDRVFQLLGYTLQSRWPDYGPPIGTAISSFDRLTDRRDLAVEPRRIEIVAPDRSMSLEEFARRYGASVPAETLATVNGLDPAERLVAGRSYKNVVGGVLPD